MVKFPGDEISGGEISDGEISGGEISGGQYDSNGLLKFAPLVARTSLGPILRKLLFVILLRK